MKEKRVRILIADDHKLMADGITALLADEPSIELTGTASNGEIALEIIRSNPVDVLLSDINMPVMDGIQLARKVQELGKGIRIIALSMHNESSMITEMLDAGATGYVLKNTGKEELLRAIRKVMEGGMYFSEEVSAEMMKKMSERASKPNQEEPVTLTAREIEIVQLISRELSNAAIAEKLFISERTVETHRKNIFRKTGTKTVVGLIQYAMKKKLIT